MVATRRAKKGRLVTRKELLLKLDQELSGVHHTLVVALNDFVGALTNIIEHIFGENFILDIWWDWHRGGPTIFIRPTGSVQDTMGGLDIDIEQAIDAGYTPLSAAIQDRLERIGMSWYDVRAFGCEYYMPEKELDVFVKEFNRLKKKVLLEINQRFSIAYDLFVDTCNELTKQVKDILTCIWGKDSILDAWWDWDCLGPVIFIKLAPNSRDIFESGSIPLSDVITDHLSDLGMSWKTVKIWGHECYISQGESDKFAQELGKLINRKIKCIKAILYWQAHKQQDKGR
jgi:hypothetical protein